MKLSDIKRVLSERDLRLTKSLGQNFMHDQNQVRRIVEAAGLQSGDRVLEIGPGLGPLTEVLVARAGNVLAIEIDRRLFEYLRNKFDGVSNLQLLHGDALEYVKQNHCWRGWKLVANLPYSIASPLLVELAQTVESPERMVAVLQIEVARRIIAPAGSHDYGIISLLLRARYDVVDWFKIPASCFFPAPKIDSACVILQRRVTPLLSPENQLVFTRILKRGFSERRKMMFKLLKEDWAEASLATAFATAGIDSQVRAEQVSLEQFVILAQSLAPPAEVFDIVNERDEVVGQMPRSQVHREGHRHRAIHVLVFNARGEVFLQKRSMSKDTFPGAWDSSASGHLDTGEQYDACALREVREELGITLDFTPERLFKIKACLETGQEFVWVYRLQHEGPFVLHPDEIERGQWFAPMEVTRWANEKPGDFAPSFLLIWRRITGPG